ncbi:MAG: TRAP transporter substrate-binding protein DctP [Alphaproteobacteria bacterium]|nr:TRAP transporter substrate-binding protein DctP [Alphaproteobacteria bacterium]
MQTKSRERRPQRGRRSRLHGPLSAIGIALCALALAAAPAWAATYTMTIAHLYPDDLTNNEVAPSLERFKQIVESATNGDIEVKVFGGGALGSEVETGKQAQAGKTIQSVLMSSGAQSSFFKNYQIVTTPFLFPNYKTAWAFFDSPWFANFIKGMRTESGLRYLGTFDDGGGFVAFTNNKRLIKSVADIKGLRIRVEENPAHIATMKALGATATPLPWGEVQTALATGLADGQFNAPGVNDIFKLYDVTKYTTWSGHVYNSVTWSVSEAWFSKLPPDHQKTIIRAAREAVSIGHGIATQISVIGWANSCKKFEGCHILSDAEKAKMRDIARPAFRQWITKDFGIDGKLVDDLWSEVDRVSADLESSWMDSYLQ